MPYHPPRLLIIPGLRDSGPTHWQSWLQIQYRDARRVQQRDFSTPDLPRWSERIQRTLESAESDGHRGGWIAVAHSFGCLALAEHLAARPDSPIREALLVAPADTDRRPFFAGVPLRPLPFPSILVASDNDPHLELERARLFARHWGSRLVNLGQAGHINVESGFGPWPEGETLLAELRAGALRPPAGLPVPTVFGSPPALAASTAI